MPFAQHFPKVATTAPQWFQACAVSARKPATVRQVPWDPRPKASGSDLRVPIRGFAVEAAILRENLRVAGTNDALAASRGQSATRDHVCHDPAAAEGRIPPAV